MKIRLEREADEEFTSAILYLESQAPGLAEKFLEDIEAAKRLLLQFPHCGSPAEAGTRRLVLRRFSYQLIYRVERDQIAIYAIAHHKQEPGYWVTRVHDRGE